MLTWKFKALAYIPSSLRSPKAPHPPPSQVFNSHFKYLFLPPSPSLKIAPNAKYRSNESGEYAKASWEIECANACSNFGATVEGIPVSPSSFPFFSPFFSPPFLFYYSPLLFFSYCFLIWYSVSQAYPPYQYVDVIGGTQSITFSWFWCCCCYYCCITNGVWYLMKVSLIFEEGGREGERERGRGGGLVQSVYGYTRSN